MCPPSRPPRPGPGAELRGLQGEAEEIDILISIYIYDRRGCVPSARTTSWTLTCLCGHRRSARTSACKCSVLVPSSSSRCLLCRQHELCSFFSHLGSQCFLLWTCESVEPCEGCMCGPPQPSLASCQVPRLLADQWSLLTLAKNLNFMFSRLNPV